MSDEQQRPSRGRVWDAQKALYRLEQTPFRDGDDAHSVDAIAEDLAAEQLAADIVADVVGTVPAEDRTPVVTSFLMGRTYDRNNKRWGPWGEITGHVLRESFGRTPEEWKTACRSWIDMGGLYEYRIGTRTDVVEWETTCVIEK